jgi:hypothetical protein|tara:strand:+ start:1932 stop:2171 length:240 start_codon:yes stop_codon:yes gene_type:complete
MKTDEQFLMDRMSMMETSGWLDLKEDMSNLESNITNVDNINSEQDLWAVKGQLRVINFILSLETATTIALEELQDGNPT